MSKFVDHEPVSQAVGPSGEMTERDWARQRVQRKRKLRDDVVAYVAVNVFLTGIWVFTGAGYFWPGWVLAGWGVMLLLDTWNVYHQRPITDADIDREMSGRR